MKSSLYVVALSAVALSVSPALALDECVVEGNPAIFGADIFAAFSVNAGQGCIHGVHVRGSIDSSEISEPAKHGMVKMLDKATWIYEPAPGYRGPDSFAITARGTSIHETPGTSVVRFSVTVN